MTLVGTLEIPTPISVVISTVDEVNATVEGAAVHKGVHASRGLKGVQAPSQSYIHIARPCVTLLNATVVRKSGVFKP